MVRQSRATNEQSLLVRDKRDGQHPAEQQTFAPVVIAFTTSMRISPEAETMPLMVLTRTFPVHAGFSMVP